MDEQSVKSTRVGGHAGFNLHAVVRQIENRAIVGLNKTLKFTHGRAQHHAPVRNIFKGSRSRTKISGIRTRAATSAGVMRAYQTHKFNSEAQLNAVLGSRGPGRRIATPKALTLSDARRLYAVGGREALEQASDIINGNIERPGLGRGGTGNARSEVPIFRQGRVTIAGSRQVAGGRLVPTAYLAQTSGGKVHIRPAPVDKTTGDPYSVSETQLSSKGRYEVRTGRAIFHAVGGDQIGGSLRGSIVMIEATLASREGGVIWGYIRAGNEDVDYARYQEYGTRHNRAHPFLRPALYESRERFKTNVVNSLQGIKTRGL